MIGHTFSHDKLPEKTGPRALTVEALLAALMVVSGCGGTDTESPLAAARAIDDAALRLADERADDWLTQGRTYSEQRFSPLDQITDQNVNQLGLAWSSRTGTDRGLEATPLLVDGIMYTTGSWSEEEGSNLVICSYLATLMGWRDPYGSKTQVPGITS